MNPIEKLIQEVTVCLTGENISKPMADALKIALFDCAHFHFPTAENIDAIESALDKNKKRRGL